MALTSKDFESTTSGAEDTGVLWGFEYIRHRGVSGLADPKMLWAYSKQMRLAMRYRLQVLRAREEIAMTELEIRRLFRWLTRRMANLNTLASNGQTWQKYQRVAATDVRLIIPIYHELSKVPDLIVSTPEREALLSKCFF